MLGVRAPHPPASAILLSLSGRGEVSKPTSSGNGKRGASLGIQTPVQEGVVGWGWEARPLPVVTTTSVSPSVALRLYLEERVLPGSGCHGNTVNKELLPWRRLAHPETEGAGRGCAF